MGNAGNIISQLSREKVLQTLNQAAQKGRNLSNVKSLAIKTENNASDEKQCILYCLEIGNHRLESGERFKAIHVRNK